jgi:hypothetical protein
MIHVRERTRGSPEVCRVTRQQSSAVASTELQQFSHRSERLLEVETLAIVPTFRPIIW